MTAYLLSAVVAAPLEGVEERHRRRVGARAELAHDSLEREAEGRVAEPEPRQPRRLTHVAERHQHLHGAAVGPREAQECRRAILRSQPCSSRLADVYIDIDTCIHRYLHPSLPPSLSLYIYIHIHIYFIFIYMYYPLAIDLALSWDSSKMLAHRFLKRKRTVASVPFSVLRFQVRFDTKSGFEVFNSKDRP